MNATIPRGIGALLSVATAICGLLFAWRMVAWLGALPGMDVGSTVWTPRMLPWLAALLSLSARLVPRRFGTGALALAVLASYPLLSDGLMMVSTLQGFDTPLRLLARATGGLEIALALLNALELALVLRPR